jgi:hypothetical protein
VATACPLRRNDVEMPRVSFLPAIILLIFLSSFPAMAQSFEKAITSEHVLVRVPPEWETLGRDSIADIERCYLFMNGATGEKLPRKVYLIVDWEKAESSCIQQEAKIILGMNKRAATVNPRESLMNLAAREIGRLGLLQISGGAEREDNAFLFEGMVEILAQEYAHNSRKIEGAWVIAQCLDQMGKLGFAQQRSWAAFSEGRRSLRNAAPGITFLTMLRELQGREKPPKFFESLKKASLTASLAAVFKSPAGELEAAWLKRVREYKIPDEITTNPEDIPKLLKTVLNPESCKPGETLDIRLFLKDAAGNLLPDGVFLKDERTGRIVQASAPSPSSADNMTVSISVDANCPPGKYQYLITAVDESGNVRRWQGSYLVLAP